MKLACCKHLLLRGAFLLLAYCASAATFTFTGGAGTDWSDARNWSISGVTNVGVPGENDTAIIGPNSIQAEVFGDVTVQNLVVTNQGSLDIEDNITVRSVFNFSSGAPMQNPTLNGLGSLILNGNSVMYVVGYCNLSCGVDNNGLIELFSSGGYGAAHLLCGGGTLLNNAGTLQLQGGTVLNGGVTLLNSGAILMNDSSSNTAYIGESTSNPGPNILNSGLVEVDGGTLSLWPADGNTNNGEYQANGVLQLHYTNYFGPPSKITGLGVCQSDGYVQAAASILGTNAATVTGTFEMDAGYLDKDGSIYDALIITNTGQFRWKGGILNNTCKIGPEATLLISGPAEKDLDTFGDIVNMGETDWTGAGNVADLAHGSTNVHGFENKPSGMFIADNDATIGVDLYNQGTFRKRTGLAGARTTITSYQGSGGTVLVDSGTLSISGGGLLGDSFTVTQDGALLEFVGGTFGVNANSAITTTSGSACDIHLLAIFNLNADFIGGAYALSVSGNLHFNGNEINGPGDLKITQGNLFWEGGTIAANLITMPGTVSIITNNAGQGFQDCIISNYGVVEIMAPFGLTDAEFDNEPGGQVQVVQPADVGGPTNSTIVNQGLWTVATAVQSHILMPFQNSGTLDNSGQIFAQAMEQSAGNFNFANSNALLFLSQPLTLNGGSLTGNSGGPLNGPDGSGVSGNVIANFANISPGNSPGVLWVNGNYTSTSNTTVTIQLGGLTAGTQYDQFNVTGTATLKGSLNVSLINHFTPALGNQFNILTYGANNGEFPVKNGLELGGGLFLLPVYSSTNLTLVVTNLTVITPSLGIAAGASNSTVNLTWPSIAGQPYQVEFSPNLTQWYLLTNLNGTGSPLNFTDPTAVSNNPARFYRLR